MKSCLTVTCFAVVHCISTSVRIFFKLKIIHKFKKVVSLQPPSQQIKYKWLNESGHTSCEKPVANNHVLKSTKRITWYEGIILEYKYKNLTKHISNRYLCLGVCLIALINFCLEAF